LIFVRTTVTDWSVANHNFHCKKKGFVILTTTFAIDTELEESDPFADV